MVATLPGRCEERGKVAPTGVLADRSGSIRGRALRLGLEADRELMESTRTLDSSRSQTLGGHRSQRRGIRCPALCWLGHASSPRVQHATIVARTPPTCTMAQVTISRYYPNRIRCHHGRGSCFWTR